MARGGADGKVWLWQCATARVGRAWPAPRPVSGQAKVTATAEHVATLEALLGSAQEGARALQQVPLLAGRPPAAMRRTFDSLVQAEGECCPSTSTLLSQQGLWVLHQVKR